jgi:hypothetical protein
LGNEPTDSACLQLIQNKPLAPYFTIGIQINVFWKKKSIVIDFNFLKFGWLAERHELQAGETL